MPSPLIPPPIPNPLMPPPNPATTPSMGFGIWAQDPQNALKVIPSMTEPNRPLQPGAGAPQMAAANPPQIQSPLIPPSIPGAPPALPTPPPSFPSLPPPLVQSGAQAQLGKDQATLSNLQQSGAAVNHVKNPVLRTLGQIGNIAAPFLVGQGAKWIPGTTAHNLLLQGEQGQRIDQDQAAITSQQTQLKDAADLGKTQAETAAIPINAGQKRQTYLAALAGKGLKEDGSGNIVPDESSPVYMKNQADQGLVQAHTDAFKAQTDLRAAQTAVEKAKNDPNSPAYKLALQKLAVAQQNANAAGQRAQAYMGRYMQSAYNLGLDGKFLPGSTQIADESGNTTTVGTANASLAAKSQANVAQFNDIEGATNNIEKAATNLVGKGGKLNDPRVAAAIADPESNSGQWAQGEFATSGLTPEQRDYVVQVKAYKENLQSLRKSAGGGVSDSQVDRLMSLAPGAGTPDLDYLKRQTDQIRQMRGRLASGVTTAGGGLKVAGKPTGNPMVPPTQTGQSYKQTATGQGGHKIGSNDGVTWFDVQSGKRVN